MQSDALPYHPLVLPDPLPVEGPLVSVLIPVHDQQEFLTECVLSVRMQTYRSFEVIISDDYSTYGSLKAIESMADTDPRITVLYNDSPLGPRSNLARLLELASGSLVKVLDAGDRFCRADALARLVAAVQSEPGVVLATGWRGFVDGEGNSQNADDLLGLPGDVIIDGKFLGDLALLNGWNCIGDCQVLFRGGCLAREDLLAIGGVTPGLFADDDIVRWLNILSHGDAAFLAELVAQRRLHGHERNRTAKLGKLQWPGDWYQLVMGARNLGFLENPIHHRHALTSLLRLLALNFEGLASQAESEWEELGQAMHNIVEEMVGLFITTQRKSSVDD